VLNDCCAENSTLNTGRASGIQVQTSPDPSSAVSITREGCSTLGRVYSERKAIWGGKSEEKPELDNINDDRIEDGVELDETFTGTEQRGGRSVSILEGAVMTPATLSEVAVMLRARVKE
jgi:hypothetical protein